MARRVVWAPTARNDLAHQLRFIAQEDLSAARLVRDRVGDAVVRLALHPIGRPGRVPGTYEKRVAQTSLIIAYEIGPRESLHILRVVHASRLWRSGEWPTEDGDQ